jgi:hypothetical protein
VAHGTDVCDFRRSGCRHTPFLRSRKCCLLSHKKNLTGRSRAAADDVNGTGPARRLAWQSRDKRDRSAQSRPRDQSRTTVAIARTTEIGEPAAKLPNHRPPNGKPNALPTVAASAAQRSGSALAECTQEITAAWVRYAEEVMRHTSEASQARLRARTFIEILEVQAKLLRENMQAFLDQSVRIAEAASRMATRPLEELKAASTERPRS